MMRLKTSPIPIGLTPDCLSKGINLYARKASSCFPVLYWYNLLVRSAIVFLKCSPDLLKFPETSFLRQPSASNTEGPVEHRVSFIVSLTISESILSYITGCTS